MLNPLFSTKLAYLQRCSIILLFLLNLLTFFRPNFSVDASLTVRAWLLLVVSHGATESGLRANIWDRGTINANEKSVAGDVDLFWDSVDES